MTLPQPSRLPPVNKNHPPVEDGRRKKSAWDLLVWAYADELAAAASPAAPGCLISEMKGPRLAQASYARDSVGRGSLAGWYDPPADARLIDEKLRAWFAHDGEALQRVISHAEKRTVLPPSIALVRRHEVHRCNDDGQPIYVYLNKLGAPVGSGPLFEPGPHSRVKRLVPVMVSVGMDPGRAEALEAAYRSFYAVFLAFLDAMQDFALVRWKCEERGLTDQIESLTT